MGSCLGSEWTRKHFHQFAFESRQSCIVCFVDSLLHFFSGGGGEGGITLRLANILTNGIRNTSSRLLLPKIRDKRRPDGSLGLNADFTFKFKARNLFKVTKSSGANKLIYIHSKIYLIATAPQNKSFHLVSQHQLTKNLRRGHVTSPTFTRLLSLFVLSDL